MKYIKAERVEDVLNHLMQMTQKSDNVMAWASACMALDELQKYYVDIDIDVEEPENNE